jgi:hypothetical protein
MATTHPRYKALALTCQKAKKTAETVVEDVEYLQSQVTPSEREQLYGPLGGHLRNSCETLLERLGRFIGEIGKLRRELLKTTDDRVWEDSEGSSKLADTVEGAVDKFKALAEGMNACIGGPTPATRDPRFWAAMASLGNPLTALSWLRLSRSCGRYLCFRVFLSKKAKQTYHELD